MYFVLLLVPLAVLVSPRSLSPPFRFFSFFSFSRSLSLSGAPRLQVRRACAPVLGIRKSLICESFRYPLVNLEETKYFGPSRDGLNTPSFDVQYFFAPSLCALPWFLQLLRGAAEAAAGRGSPPPPRAGVVSVRRYRRVSPVSLKHSEKRDRRGRGLEWPPVPSPRPPGPPRSRGMAKIEGPGWCGNAAPAVV